MPSFPAWGVAILIASSGVWFAMQYDRGAAWSLAILIVLGVLIMRDSGLPQFQSFITNVLGTPASKTVTPVVENPMTDR